MSSNQSTRRNGPYPIRTYLPDWAKRLLAMVERNPNLSQYLSRPSDALEGSLAAGSIHDRSTHVQQGPSMRKPLSLNLHQGDRDHCVRSLQQALYRALMADDPVALDQALALDQRLSRRATLRPVEASPLHSEPESSPD